MIMFVKQTSRSVTGHASGFLLTGVKAVLAIPVEDNFFPRTNFPRVKSLETGRAKNIPVLRKEFSSLSPKISGATVSPTERSTAGLKQNLFLFCGRARLCGRGPLFQLLLFVLLLGMLLHPQEQSCFLHLQEGHDETNSQ